MPRLNVLFALAATASLALSGCPTNDGVDPPVDQLFYPIALAADPDGHALYVVSSDFDLRYNGGTVVSLDLDMVRAAVANPGNFNCRPDRSAPGAHICDEAQFVRRDQTRKINPFAVDAALGRFASGRERLYVIVRGDNSLTWLDAAPSGTLDCGASGVTEFCTDAHRVGIDPGQALRGDVLPQEPASLSVDASRGWITVVHQNNDPTYARASLFWDRDAVRTTPIGSSPQLMNVVTGLPRGLAYVLRLEGFEADTARATWLATSRTEGLFTVLQAYPGNGALEDKRPFLYRTSIAAVNGLNNGANNRGAALDPTPGAHRAFVVSRAPEALLTVDLSNLNAPTVTDFQPVAGGPSRVLANYDATTHRTLVYVVSYDARRITVVEPDAHRVAGQIFTHRGPHQIVRDPNGRFLYMVDFLDNTVEVIDIQPGGGVDPSEPANRRVLTLGEPSAPEVSR